MKTAVSWSSGKDSMLTLHSLFEQGVEAAGLLCTLTESYRRVSMHGVRMELVEMQARSLGLPLIKSFIPPGCSNEAYEDVMHRVCVSLKRDGVEAVAFGDIFLEDVRRYRERNLEKAGLAGLFPLWGRSTEELAERFLSLSYRAVVVAVDLEKLSTDYCGREFDHDFLSNLPSGCDPCGENGEFHTFVYAGPLLSKPVEFTPGGKVVREERFCFQDLLPAV
ncbi:MAG: diphthine--ammonia ligase [Candidatus Caldarchaeum sp.]